ncbi:MAG TPA: hypothetical protein VJ946_06255, partial [Bacteroidales bacterium]|nr:hypothetical protein [Bacteroidales bacterium]
AHNREKDLQLFKDEITELMAGEIVSRYYYQKGQIKYNLKSDTDVEQALKLVSSKQKMDSILHVNN